MFIHIGSGKSVKKSDLIGIFDIDGKITPEITANFLKKAQKEGKVDSAGEDLPKSFVLVGNKDKTEIIFSHISSTKLAER